MTNYLDTYDYYETPLFEGRSAETGGYQHDPVRQVQIRMLVIFAMALMVASAFTLLALPHDASSTAGVGAPIESQLADVQTAANTVAASSEARPAAGREIAPLFTKEVQYWEADIIRWANDHDLDPNAVATIMQIESCGNPAAVSVAGARGLFQVMPFHFTAGEDMMDPDTNAFRGLNFLNEQLRYTSGDLLLSFAGYNGGYAASGGNYDGWPSETKRYYQWAKGIYEDARSGASRSETLDAWLDAGGKPGCDTAAGNLGI